MTGSAERGTVVSALLRRFRPVRTVYGCGNCMSSFKSDAARKAHLDEHGVCPQVTFERKLAEHNADMELQIFLNEVLPDE